MVNPKRTFQKFQQEEEEEEEEEEEQQQQLEALLDRSAIADGKKSPV